MSIYENSRYETATVIMVTDADDVTRPTVYPTLPTIGTQQKYSYYHVKAGDHLDLISNNLYGSPEFWWVIAQLNPEILDPQNIAAGTVIRLPR